MKKRNRIVIITIIFLLAILLISFCIFHFSNKEEYISNVGGIQKVNNSVVIDAIIEGVELSSGSIENNDGVYIINMIATNNTNNIIDMGEYRISFRNQNDEEIEWFRGTVIGKLSPKESRKITIESAQDLSNLVTLHYIKYDFGD